MIWPSIIGGFSLGVIGSMHCVGMCGPLALALPVYHLDGLHKFISLLLYQLGRVTTYASLGLLFGIMGRSLYIAGVQQWLSTVLGAVIVLVVLFSLVKKGPVHTRILRHFYLNIQKTIANLLRHSKGPGGFFLMGLANGLLPCGMVYIAIAASLSAGEVGQSILFMVFFGLGTLPAMMIISYLGRAIPMSVRSSMRKAIPYFVAFMGVLLILRGLNLNIPFISPAMPVGREQAVSCHH